MAEQPIKPENTERELSIDEFLEILHKKFQADNDLLEVCKNFLEKYKVRFFKSKNLKEKFSQQQAEWKDGEIMPLYDKGLGIFFTLKMGGHTYLRAFLYAFRRGIIYKTWSEIEVAGHYGLADGWSEERMGWYVSGGDFSLVKSLDYRGTKQEEEVFAYYTRIQNI